MSEPAARPDYTRLLAGGFDLRGRAAFVPGGYGGIGEAAQVELTGEQAGVVGAFRRAIAHPFSPSAGRR